MSVKKGGDEGRELSSPENSYLFHPNLRPLVIQPENGMISDDRVTSDRERKGMISELKIGIFISCVRNLKDGKPTLDFVPH